MTKADEIRSTNLWTWPKEDLVYQCVELHKRITALEAERDAWRAATGLAGLTPEEAGDKIDEADEETAKLRAVRDAARKLQVYDPQSVIALHEALAATEAKDE